MGSYRRLTGESWKDWLKELMGIHNWSITRVAELTNHPRSIIGYWLAGKRVAYLNTQIAVRAMLEKEKIPKSGYHHEASSRRDLKAFLKRWEGSRDE